MSWINTTLKKYVDLNSGCPFKSDHFQSTGIPIVKIGNIVNYSTIKTKHDDFINPEDIEKYQEYTLSEGDVLIAMSGNTTCKMGRVSKGFSPSLLNQRVGWIFPTSNEVEISYVYYLLVSETYQRRLWTFATATGQPNLSPRDIKRVKFSKPPVKEQKAIAGILSKVDTMIEAVEESITAAEHLKKALMQNLLTGKLKPDGTWRTDDEFYVDEKMGLVPKGWQTLTINELFKFHPTSSYSRSKLIEIGRIGYIHYGDIHTKFDRVLDLESEHTPYIPDELEKNYEHVKDGDLVVSDASEDWDGVGKAIEILNAGSQKVICGLHTLHLRPKTNDFILGIMGYILNTYASSRAIKRLATGAKVYGVSKSELKKVTIILPSCDEQIKIKETLDYFSKEIRSKSKKIKTLERLKKSLMQNLLTGKKRVDVEKINLILNQS